MSHSDPNPPHASPAGTPPPGGPAGVSPLQQLLARLRGGGLGAVLARGAAGSFMVTVAGTGLLYLTHLMLARLLGVDHYGVYAYVLTWCELLLITSRIGLDTTIVRYGAAYSGKEQWPLFWGLLSWSDRTALGASLLTSAGIAGAAWLLGERISAELRHTFFVAALVEPLWARALLRESALRALGHATLSRAMPFIARPLLVMALVGGIYLFYPRPLDGTLAMIGYALAMAGVLTFGVVALRRHTEPVHRRGPRQHEKRQWLAMALPALVISAMTVLLQYTDKIMLGILLSTREAGVYVIVTKTSYLVTIGLNAVNTILAPMISRLYSQEQQGELQRLLTLGARGSFALSLPPALILLVAGRLVLSMFGAEFTAGYAPLLVAVVGQLVNATAGSTGYLMLMTGHQTQMALVFGGCALLNIGLNFLLIPVWGMVGAALSTAGCLVLWNALILVYIWRKLRLNPTVVRF